MSVNIVTVTSTRRQNEKGMGRVKSGSMEAKRDREKKGTLIETTYPK